MDEGTGGVVLPITGMNSTVNVRHPSASTSVLSNPIDRRITPTTVNDSARGLGEMMVEASRNNHIQNQLPTQSEPGANWPWPTDLTNTGRVVISEHPVYVRYVQRQPGVHQSYPAVNEISLPADRSGDAQLSHLSASNGGPPTRLNTQTHNQPRGATNTNPPGQDTEYIAIRSLHGPYNDEGPNFDVCDFFEYWKAYHDWSDSSGLWSRIGEQAMILRDIQRPSQITANDLDGDRCDLQGLNWWELGTMRTKAQAIRSHLYTNPSASKSRTQGVPHALVMTGADATIPWTQTPMSLPSTDSYFRFRRLNTAHDVHLAHFELRNSSLAACSRNSIFYTGESKIMCFDSTLNTKKCVLDFTQKSPGQEGSLAMTITALYAGNGILLAGGFEGDYAMKSLFSDENEAFTSGLVTKCENGITNHIHTFLDRRNGLPQAVFSSNDKVRVLDCHTNTFVYEHSFPSSVNCSATSPDTRLRLHVGDHNHPWISDAEGGKCIAQLQSYQGYGFACDWADDGIHMATSSESGIVQIWDARNWAYPLQTMDTEIGSVRTMHFSPVGGGRPVLLLAELADIVSVVDAATFETRQRFDFFGRIAGVSFVPDGRTFFVANEDQKFGGLMEFERISCGDGFGVVSSRRRSIQVEREIRVHGDRIAHDWIDDDDLDDDPRVVHMGSGYRRNGMDYEDVIF